MVTLKEEVKDLILSENVRKNFRVSFPGGEHVDIINDSIVREAVQLTESFCSQDEFKLGLAESNVLEFTCVDSDNIKDLVIDAQLEVDASSLGEEWCEQYAEVKEDLDYPIVAIKYGRFRIDEAKKDATMLQRKVVAYSLDDDFNTPNVTGIYAGRNYPTYSWWESLKSDYKTASNTMRINLTKLLFFMVGVENTQENGFTLHERAVQSTRSEDSLLLAWDYKNSNGETYSIGCYSTKTYTYQLSQGELIKVGFKNQPSAAHISTYQNNTISEIAWNVIEPNAERRKTLLEDFKERMNVYGLISCTTNSAGIKIDSAFNLPMYGYLPSVASGNNTEIKTCIHWIVKKGSSTISTTNNYLDVVASNIGLYEIDTNVRDIYANLTGTRTSDGKYSYESTWKETDLNTLLPAAIELMGRSAKVNRDGIFELIDLAHSYLYPLLTIYPGVNVYSYGAPTYTKTRYQTVWFDDENTEQYVGATCSFTDQSGDTVTTTVYANGYNESSPGRIYDISNNEVIRTNSFALSEITDMLENIAETMARITYRRCSMTCVGLPWVECEDFITVNTGEDAFRTLGMRRVLKGIQTLTDSFES